MGTWAHGHLFALVVVTRALLANFRHVPACTPHLCSRDSGYALNLANCGKDTRAISFGLAMKFVDRAPFLSILLTGTFQLTYVHLSLPTCTKILTHSDAFTSELCNHHPEVFVQGN
jgi:hypothetical protein